MDFDDEGKIKCPRCKRKGDRRVRFYYKEKAYYYYLKCGHCWAKGYLDWIEVARGRLPGIVGLFFDIHPAGSAMIAPEKFGGRSVYDGHEYISTKTKRGEALWNKFVSGDEE